MKTLGQIAYDAFIKSVSEEGYCPYFADWFNLVEKYKVGWEEAAKAAYEEGTHRMLVKVGEELRYRVEKKIV